MPNLCAFSPTTCSARRTAGNARRAVISSLIGLALLAGCASVPGPNPPKPPLTLTPARIDALLASPDRSEADRANDPLRKSAQMLAFIGIRPGMVALDLSAGGGYTTELLARAVGPEGEVYGQSAPRSNRPAPAQPEGGEAPAAPTSARPGTPAVPPRTSATAVTARADKLKGTTTAANIAAIVQPFEDPVPPGRIKAGLDLVTLMFNYHDLGHMGVDRARMNAAVFAALKPGGIYVIADHAGRAGTGISEAGTLHRVEEAFLRAEVERAGFKLAAEGQFLRNPNDPRDRNTPEPAQPKDEFVLKFVKP